MKHDLQLAGFKTAASFNNCTTVHTSWIKVAGLLKDAGLAAMPEQNLSIKLEIDTRPPVGAVSETGIVNRQALLSLRYYNLPSLMARTVHALMTRNYAKGRDWYDFVWYRAIQPPVDPNLVQLQNALDQTQGEGRFFAENWKQDVAKKVRSMDCRILAEDVRDFLEHPEESALLTEENICSVLR